MCGRLNLDLFCSRRADLGGTTKVKVIRNYVCTFNTISSSTSNLTGKPSEGEPLGLKDKSKGVGLGLVDAVELLEGTKDDEGEKEGDFDN